MVGVRARRRRDGRSSLGCLFVLLLFAAAIYFGFPVGEVYYRRYRFEDAMRQQARFAGLVTDAVIRRRLNATADTLGIPEAAENLRIARGANRITIESYYREHVELPFYARDFRFTPRAVGTF